MNKSVYTFGGGADSDDPALTRQDQSSAARAPIWPKWPAIGLPVPPGLHDHHRGMRALSRRRRRLLRRAARRSRRRAGPYRERCRQEVRRCRRSAAGLRPLGRARFDAGHDGHGAQSRPQRRDGRRACRHFGRRALRLGLAIAASSRCIRTWCSASITACSRKRWRSPRKTTASTPISRWVLKHWKALVAEYKRHRRNRTGQAVPAGCARTVVGRDRARCSTAGIRTAPRSIAG